MIQFSGRRGAHVSTIRSKLEIISDFEPEIVILPVGSNDLCRAVNDVDPQSMASTVADDIFAIAEHIITRFKGSSLCKFCT